MKIYVWISLLMLTFYGCSKDKSKTGSRSSAADGGGDKKVVEETGTEGGGESATGNTTGKTDTGVDCEYPKTYDVNDINATYSRSIMKLVEQNCETCHGGANPSDGLSLAGGYTNDFYKNVEGIVTKVNQDHNAGHTNNNTKPNYHPQMKNAFTLWSQQGYARNPKGEVWVGTKCDGDPPK